MIGSVGNPSATPLPQRLSLITLGVADLARSRRFYEGLGFTAAPGSEEGVAFFDMNGVILALYSGRALAEDANVPHTEPSFRGVSCAINVASEAEVGAALDFVAARGARVTQPAAKAFWGGYLGYFSDPDGHLWEVAYNPFWPLDESGRPQLPGRNGS